MGDHSRLITVAKSLSVYEGINKSWFIHSMGGPTQLLKGMKPSHLLKHSYTLKTLSSVKRVRQTHRDREFISTCLGLGGMEG